MVRLVGQMVAGNGIGGRVPNNESMLINVTAVVRRRWGSAGVGRRSSVNKGVTISSPEQMASNVYQHRTTDWNQNRIAMVV